MSGVMELASKPVAEASFRSAPPITDGDIVAIVRWALSRTGRLPWRNPADWELSLDQGLTVRCRKDRGRWYLVEAGVAEMAARDRLPGGPTPSRVPGHDAAAVVAAIKALSPRMASLILSHGNAGTVPEWIDDDRPPQPVYRDPPRQHEIRIVDRIGPKRKQQRVPPFCPLAWPVSFEAICASQEVYSTWHAGMTALATALDGALRRWPRVRFDLPAEPWRKGQMQPA